MQQGSNELIGLKWRETDDWRGREPEEQVTCPFCHESMLLERCTVGPHGILNAFVDTHVYKCPQCSYTAFFQFAVSPTRAQQLAEKRGTAMRLNTEEWEADERIAEKLKELGYF